jgi:drug/metabolite transporter (DMT)-like permease
MTDSKPLLSNTTKGVLLGLLGAFFMAVLGIFVKLGGNRLPDSEMLFARFFISLLLVIPFLIKDKNFTWKVQRPGMLLLRCLSGYGSMVCLFYTMQHMPLSNSLLFLNTGPLFVPFFVWLLLKTKTDKKIWGCIFAGLVGVAIILNPAGHLPVIPGMVGVLNGLFAGFSFVVIRQLTLVNNPKKILFYFFLFGTLVTLCSAPFTWKLPHGLEWLYLLLIGFFGLVFQYFLTHALAKISSRLMTPLLYSEVIFAGIFDWVFWNESLKAAFIVGAVIIVVAIIFLVNLNAKAKLTT